MIFHYSLSGAQQIFKKYPLYSAGTTIPSGSAVVKGATPGTNQGFGIVAPASCAGILGVTTIADSLGSQLDSKQDGTLYTRYKLIINPDAVFNTKIASPSVAAIAVASTSTTTVTITSLEDDIDGGWLYGNDYQLQWIATATSGSCTTKTATGWTSANTVTRVLPLFKILQDLDATANFLKPAAAIGTGKIITLENYITIGGFKREVLDPTKHSGATYDAFTTLHADIIFQNHAFANIGAS